MDGGAVVGGLVDSRGCSLTVVAASEVVTGAVEASDSSTVVVFIASKFSGGEVVSRSFNSSVAWGGCGSSSSSSPFEISPLVALISISCDMRLSTVPWSCAT